MLIYFRTIGALKTRDIPRKFNNRCVQAVTNAQVRNFVTAGITGCQNFTFKTPTAEPTRH